MCEYDVTKTKDKRLMNTKTTHRLDVNERRLSGIDAVRNMKDILVEIKY